MWHDWFLLYPVERDTRHGEEKNVYQIYADGLSQLHMFWWHKWEMLRNILKANNKDVY